MNTAAEWATLDVMKKLKDMCHVADEGTLQCAAYRNDVQMMRWIKENFPDVQCMTMAIEIAAMDNYMDILHCIAELYPDTECMPHVTAKAANAGHLDVLKWIHEHYDNMFDHFPIQNAIFNGFDDIVEWLMEHYPDQRPSVEFVHNLLHRGHLKKFQLVERLFGKYDESYCIDGWFGERSIKTIIWLLDHGRSVHHSIRPFIIIYSSGEPWNSRNRFHKYVFSLLCRIDGIPWELCETSLLDLVEQLALHCTPVPLCEPRMNFLTMK